MVDVEHTGALVRPPRASTIGDVGRLGERLPSQRVRLVHLTAIWAYGVSQPAISLVQGNQEILVSQNATRLDAVLLIALIAFVPPMLALGYAWMVSRFSRWAGDMIYLCFVGAFLAPFVLQLEKRFDPGAATALLVLVAICFGAVALYVRFRAMQLFVSFSIVLPLAGLVLFAQALPPLGGEAHAAGQTTVRSPTPVVMLLLDELPVQSLMTRAGRIDETRYPNFARLAREGTWYPNATTVHDSTQAAIPSIMTGKIERRGSLPIAFNYPENLFALLGGAYELDVHEAGTRLCPRDFCPQYEAPFLERAGGLLRGFRYPYLQRVLPGSLTPTFRDVDFERAQGGKMNDALRGFEAFLAGISADEPENTLHFAHVLHPHSPWRHFPSGVEYNFDGRDGLVDRHQWAEDPWPALHAQHQHLLQLGFTDALVGRLLSKLDRKGLYDGALVIVAADHGISFRPGVSHRWVSEANIEDLANVPLFVKYPDQKVGRTDQRHARVVDIVPTITDVLGISSAWRVDGTSLLGPAEKRSGVRMAGRGGEVVSTTLSSVLEQRETRLNLKADVFGEGTDSLFRIGTNVDLLGVAAPTGARAAPAVRVRIENRAELANVDPESRYLPAQIAAVVQGGRLGAGVELAVAVNGRIRALTRPIQWEGEQVLPALVPEDSFKAGFNRVDVFVVEGRGADRRLVWLGSNAT